MAKGVPFGSTSQPSLGPDGVEALGPGDDSAAVTLIYLQKVGICHLFNL